MAKPEVTIQYMFKAGEKPRMLTSTHTCPKQKNLKWIPVASEKTNEAKNICEKHA